MPGAKTTRGRPNRGERDVFEAVGSNPCDALAGALGRSEVLLHQRLDLFTRDRWRPRARRCGPTLDRVDDQGQSASGLQHGVHRLGDTSFACPVEGLPERNHSVRSRRRPREVLGQGSDPADVRDAPFAGNPAPFGEHRWVGVEADRLLEQMGESYREDAGAGAGVEEPPAPIQIQLLGENSLQFG